MDKRILVIGFIILIVASALVFNVVQNSQNKVNKINPMVQYSAPIGPTQTPPYILPSESTLPKK